jgi:hypothetical protein
MLFEIHQDGQVGFELWDKTMELTGLDGEALGVDAPFDLERLAGFVELMAMFDVPDGLFESDGNEQAADDGGDVDEEVFPCAGSMVGGMYVEHGGGFLGWSLGRGRSEGCLSFARDGRIVWHELSYSVGAGGRFQFTASGTVRLRINFAINPLVRVTGFSET